MDLDKLSDEELMKLLVKHRPEKYGHLRELVLPTKRDRPARKKQIVYDETARPRMPDLSPLPPGQRRRCGGSSSPPGATSSGKL